MTQPNDAAHPLAAPDPLTEAVLARVFEVSADPITVTEFESGRLRMVNEGFLRMTGFRRDELIGRRAVDVGLWDEPEQRARYIEAVRSLGAVHDHPAVFRSKDGAAIDLLISASVFREGGVEYLVGSMRDVTERERERLKLAAILDNAAVGIAFTRDRVFQHVNPRFEAMFGWEPGAIIGQPGAAVWPNAEAYAELGRVAAPVLSAGEPLDVSNHQMRRRDGSRFWVRLRARAIDLRQPGSGGTIWIVEDVSEQRRAEQALARALEAAEAASRAKSEFLANTSHEIRTPLNGLLGLARLALKPGLEPALQRGYLERIQASAQALAGLFSDIVDLSKIEAGQLSIAVTDFDLHALLATIRNAYVELAAAKGLDFSLHIEPGVPAWVSGDPVRLRQVLSNYISNALKFTAAGSIAVEVTSGARDRVRLSVRDSGIGIDAQAQQRLFQPFSPGDTSTTRRHTGSGLGLSLCHQLADLMGGEVGVSSTPGQGSLFWAEVPLPLARLRSDSGPRGSDPATQLHGARILLVEDNPVNVLVAEATLREWGAEVDTAVNGAEAVSAVERAGGHYDAVLMDLHMPVMNGFDATTALRKRFGAARLPIIALTADVLVSVREAALHRGMNDFLAKPIDPERLVEVLAKWVRLARAGRLG